VVLADREIEQETVKKVRKEKKSKKDKSTDIVP
jgi:hypothetical protein